jgi:hypothetical protein
MTEDKQKELIAEVNYLRDALALHYKGLGYTLSESTISFTRESSIVRYSIELHVEFTNEVCTLQYPCIKIPLDFNDNIMYTEHLSNQLYYFMGFKYEGYPLAVTLQITEVGNLTEEPKDKDLLEKLKRVYREWVISCGEKSDVIYVESDRGELTADLISKRDYLIINSPSSIKPLSRNRLKVGGDCTLEYVRNIIKDSYEDIDKGADHVVDFMDHLVEVLEESTTEKRNRNFKIFTEKFKL